MIGVSILVVMDYIKEQLTAGLGKGRKKFSFNPCCDGLYKRTVGLEGYVKKHKMFQSLL